MSETQKILDLWRSSAERGDECLLATVVGVDGSSYRKPGARMLLTRGGLRAGTISGGCLEGEVAKKAWWLTESGATVQHYTSFYDEDSGDAYGLGCGGTVHVLLERAPAADAILSALQRNRQQRDALAVVSIVDSADHAEMVGTHLVAAANRDTVYRSMNIDVADALRKIANEVLAARRSSWHTATLAGTGCHVFAEFIAPPTELLIVGAGDDAKPLAAYGHSLDWKVTVADGRSHLARRERFPDADAVQVLAGEAPMESLPVTPETVAVLMTHSYQQDRDMLRALLPSEVAYIGVLGPKRRTAQLVHQIAAELAMSEEQCMSRIHSPVGLDLGADSPAGVALSIAAEIHAFLRARNPIPLRRKVVIAGTGQRGACIEMPGA